MRSLQKIFDNNRHSFEKGGKFEKLFPVFELVDTFIFTPDSVTETTSHVRDGIDLKRTMVTVAMALAPCVLMACYNTGLQANLAMESSGIIADGWRAQLMLLSGIGFSSANILSNFLYGLLWFAPIFLVTNVVGGIWEVLFATVRKHEVNEGFLVTGLLFPLTLPATIPLWQVAIGISFGVVFAKEIFGGTGKNIFNVALMSRVFLFFAYPAQISGDAVWVALDGYTGATALAQVAAGGMDSLTVSFGQAFLGFIPGSMGETSTLAALIGAIYLMVTGIASWRIMLGMVIGLVATALLFNNIESTTNPMFALTPAWHFVLGSFAFAMVFMATDPVTATMTDIGRWFYGILIGILGVLIRVVNPAYPEGWMLAILFMNAFAPLIDYFVVKANINRRLAR